MSDEIQAAGAAATAGLVARALEGGEAHETATGPCANCGAALSGRYCSNCGQPSHVHRSLLHMVEEALHGLVHFDSKMWRTLPKLAFRPGTLTRDYIEGKRARFVSPLALFLFCIFLTFFVFAVSAGPGLISNAAVEDAVTIEGKDEAGLREASAEIAAERDKAAREGNAAGAQALGAVQERLDADAKQKEPETPAAEQAEDEDYQGFSIAGLQHEIDEEIASGDLKINTGDAKRDERLLHAAENLELTLYKIEQATYKFAFLLVPISLPMIAFLFLWKRGVTWFDHAVFALYSLSFMSLFYLTCGLVLGAASGIKPLRDLFESAMLLAPPVHMYFQLGGAYKLGWFSALWRTIALLIICLTSFLFFLVIIVLIGVLG